ncbi:FtsX-like permease family protein [Streptomyces sp. Ag109_G2-15]|uniref:ABC transporter permease n=1 Tax=Streptomyces sp. Ag109_G2-15 TaxID=1938850 RepID=UPI000BC89B22|nr:FtsX-like permease family protein [Streptomyces sp. Ag109_G2-15]SOD89951.1 putative ABC transport system permease protein [Streptomyces sp. Ag109_G2-15]
MRAVWKAARAAVRRRRLQTLVIWLVTLVSTGSMVVALGLVDAASAPFDHVFGKQRGPHVIAAFDAAEVSDAQLAHAARQSGVEAVAGPFRQASVDLPRDAGDFGLGGEVTVVGRSGPGGPVDRVNLWAGRWPTRPGEIVLNRQSDWTADDMGKKFRVPSGPTLTIVGFAFDLSHTADAWVDPDQITALHPTGTQMLFRFRDASSERALRAGMADVTEDLPKGGLAGSETYLALKHRIGSTARAYAPYLMAFGVLGILVAVLIVANVVGGAVVSGFRHIGILKALGFTPGQVLGVYLVMISVPSVLGCALGTLAGNLLAHPFFQFVFTGPNSGVLHDSVGIAPWVNALALLGMPLVCVLAALGPSLRARRMPASRAISAGSAPRAGRALGIQRRLASARLPRSVSLGVGLPFARPARSALTLAAVALGVTTVTFATGLAATLTDFGNAGQRAFDVTVYVGNYRHGKEVRPVHSDRQLQAMLESLPGATRVTARSDEEALLVGSTQVVMCEGRRGDVPLDSVLIRGRWTHRTGEVVAGTAFLHRTGTHVGDHLRLRKGGREERLTIVGETMLDNDRLVVGAWPTVTSLMPDVKPIAYHVRLREGADQQAYARAVRAADPGLSLQLSGPNNVTRTIVGSATALTLMLALVSSLGVFNTAVLNTHDRRRDLGMLKSIGMTPRQVTVMTVTSMAVLGAVGSLLGIPLGIVSYELVIPRMAAGVDITLPSYMTDVWHTPTLAGLALAGLVIAVLGAFVPARRAARLTVAEVLRSE